MSDQQQSTTQAFPSSDQQQSSTQAFVKKTAAQRKLYESGNELAAYAAKQINYHIMGYYPITPSTQIAENLDLSGARGEHNIRLIAAEGEHSAAGICYGASAGGGRVFNATSANGLLYALEQFPVQSGTRMPMVMNVACRTVSGPLCIKGDHSDIMYLLNTGWIILFADDPQMVYDFNLIALKLAEKVNLPVVVAFDGFFTSHQKQKCMVFSEDETVQHFIGKKLSCDNPEISAFAGNDSTGENRFYSVLDLNHPVSVGSYMNEPDIINNKYQLFLAMEETRKKLPMLFDEFASLSGRMHTFCRGYLCEDADIILFLLGSSFHPATVAADTLRKEGIRAGVVTLNVLRPFPSDELRHLCMHAKTIVAADRQDSYGAGGGNMSLELRAALQDITDSTHPIRVLTRIYGLGGKDFFVEDAVALFREGLSPDARAFDYYGITPGTTENCPQPQYYAPLTKDRQSPGVTTCTFDPATGKMLVKGGLIKDATAMPKRIAPGIGTCPGCGIPVNLNLLLKGIEGNVVFLFQTGCGIVDIMMHTLERYLTPEGGESDLTDRIAEGLLIATRDAGRRAIADPRDYEARATLMWAGSVSHNDYTGCGRKRLFPVHKLEHELSAFRDEIAHGAGLSVLFPAWAEHEMQYDYPRFAQFANRVLGVEMDFEHPERTAREGIRTLRRFFEEIGMPTHLSQLGIKPENYEKLAANTVRTVNGPVKSYSPLDEKAIIEIYRLAE